MAVQVRNRAMDGPPPGFEPLFRTSPFLETVGPLFYRRDPDQGLIIGLRIAEKHANARGIAHGGLLVTLADIALGYRTAFGEDPPAGLITANLTADFAGAAKIGDWVEAHVDVQKIGGRAGRARRSSRVLVPDPSATVLATTARHKPPPPNRPRAPYQIYASDDTGEIILTYFNARRDFLEKLLPVGERRIVSGIAAFY